jgi:hypothetical protein
MSSAGLARFPRPILPLLLLAGLGCGGGQTMTPATSLPSPASGPAVCAGSGPGVAVVVDPAVAGGIRAALTTFEADLCREGYAVVETVSAFASPPDLRRYLARVHGESQGRLQGAILVGNHPHAYQWVTLHSSNPQIPSTSEEVISFQYYADLDGVFETSAAYRSPAGHAHSFDLHTGDTDWEIWVSVLPLYRNDVAQTVEALNRYFAKNHAYRSGPPALPRGFLQINEHYLATTAAQHQSLLQGLKSGEYAWTPFSDSPSARLYFDSRPGGLSVDQGYVELSAGVADFTVTDAHGFWGASGKLTIDWAESRPVRTLVFWSNGCAVGDLDRPSNFLASALYSPTSMVLAAKGTTNNSGGMGNNRNGFFGHNVAVVMSRGASLGEGVRDHVNVPLVEPWAQSREFHFATSVIFGDGSVKLRP